MRIEVLGKITIYDGDPPAKLNLRSLGRALVYLALQDGRFVRRTQMADDLWPVEGYSVSGNRLRVSLIRLKELVGDSLIVDREQVGLKGGSVEVDYYSVRNTVLEALDEVDLEHEIELLKGLLPVLGKGIAEDWDDHWLLLVRTDWQQICLRALRRLAHLAIQKQDWETVRHACEAGRVHATFDTELWRNYIDALAHYGEIESAVKELRVLAAESEDEEVSRNAQEMLTYARTVRDTLPVKDEWEQENLERHLGSVLRRFIERFPDRASEILATEEFDEFFIYDPHKSVEIFGDLMSKMGKGTPEWIAVGMRVANFHYLVYNWEDTVRVVDELLPYVDDPLNRSRLIFYRSWCFFQTRQWDKAMLDVTDCEKILSDAGMADRALSVRMNRGSYLWHMGKFDEGLAIYNELAEAAKGSNEPLHLRNLAVVHGNSIFIHLIEGRAKEAAESFAKCSAVLERIEYKNMDAMLFTVGGVTLARIGETRRGSDLLISGLRLCYERGGSRESQIGLEWAAGVLLELNRGPEAVALLDWVDMWRMKTRHERSVAEAQYAREIYDEGRAARRRVRLDPNESLRNVMAFVIRLLRQAQVSQ